jgi:hypothetical protein
MKEPFGKRNRPVVEKPALARARKHRLAAPPRSKTGAKLHFYIAGGILFLVLAAYAFA